MWTQVLDIWYVTYVLNGAVQRRRSVELDRARDTQTKWGKLTERHNQDMERNHHALKWKMRLTMIQISIQNYLLHIPMGTGKIVSIAIFRSVPKINWTIKHMKQNKCTWKRLIAACWLDFMFSGCKIISVSRTSEIDREVYPR